MSMICELNEVSDWSEDVATSSSSEMTTLIQSTNCTGVNLQYKVTPITPLVKVENDGRKFTLPLNRIPWLRYSFEATLDEAQLIEHFQNIDSDSQNNPLKYSNTTQWIVDDVISSKLVVCRPPACPDYYADTVGVDDSVNLASLMFESDAIPFGLSAPALGTSSQSVQGNLIRAVSQLSFQFKPILGTYITYTQMMLSLSQPGALERGRYYVQVKSSPSLVTFSLAEVIWVAAAKSPLVRVALLVTLVAIMIHSYYLYQLFRHREHKVMKLSQWNFLSVMVMVSIFELALLMLNAGPNRDFGCLIYQLNWLFPCLLGALIIGRLWRIYSTISPSFPSSYKRPFIYQFFDRFDIYTEKIGDIIFCRTNRRHTQNLGITRRIHDSSLWKIVLLVFSVPLTVMALNLFINPAEKTLSPVEGINVRILSCGIRVGVGLISSLVVTVCVYSLLFYCAYLAKDLPSFFNEMSYIRNLCLITALLTFLAVGIDVATISGNSHPDVRFFAFAAGRAIATVVVTTSLIHHKLVLVRKGELLEMKDIVTRESNSPNTSADSTQSDGHQVSSDDNLFVNGAETSLVRVNEQQNLKIQLLENLVSANMVIKSVASHTESCNQTTWVQIKERSAELETSLDQIDVVLVPEEEPGRAD